MTDAAGLHTLIVVAMIAGLSSVLVALINAVVGVLTLIQGRRTHKDINGRLTQLVASTDRASRAEGKAEGIAGEREKHPTGAHKVPPGKERL